MHEEDTDEEEIVEAATDEGDNTSETDNTTNDKQE